MLVSADLDITPLEYEAMVPVLNAIIQSVGNYDSGEVTSMDMHRMISVLGGAVLETDKGLTTLEQFREAGRYIGDLIAHHALHIRGGRNGSNSSLLERALAMDSVTLN